MVFVFLLAIWPSGLSAQDSNHQNLLDHVPFSSFVHGEILLVRVDVEEQVDSIRFFFRHEGIEDFQVRELEKFQDHSYRFELDTSQFTGLVFEYFFRSGKFCDLGFYSSRGWPRPETDKYYPEIRKSDPVYAVWGKTIQKKE